MSGPAPRIAVLIACHNRRALTLACLDRLMRQPLFRAEQLFLVDDGSSDGTGAAVRALLPAATVLAGDGTLFWNGGMRLAWAAARERGGFDHYLWLNDDVALADDCLAMLVADAAVAAAPDGAVVVAAATTSPDGRTITYGGHRRPRADRPLRLTLVAPDGTPQPVATVSGNIVLVSAAAERRLGLLDPWFEHIYGDLDYGLRAHAAGIPVVLASRAGGCCAANAAAGTALEPGLGRLARLRRHQAQSRRVHGRDWRRLVARHGGGWLARLGHRVMPVLRLLLDRPARHAAPLALVPDHVLGKHDEL